jgi:hypothetical protein
MWNFVLVHLEIVFFSVEDRCTVCVERTIGSEIVLDVPDGTPWRHWPCGISFRSVWRQCQGRCKIGAQFAPNIPKAHKSFCTHLMVLLGDEAQVNAHFISFGDSANLDAR